MGSRRPRKDAPSTSISASTVAAAAAASAAAERRTSAAPEQSGSRTVAKVAADNVDGYLRNASRRMRTYAAGGGRGTRRKMAMVTSADVRHLNPENDTNNSSNNEEGEGNLKKGAARRPSGIVSAARKAAGETDEAAVVDVDADVDEVEGTSGAPKHETDDHSIVDDEGEDEDSEWDDVELPYVIAKAEGGGGVGMGTKQEGASAAIKSFSSSTSITKEEDGGQTARSLQASGGNSGSGGDSNAATLVPKGERMEDEEEGSSTRGGGGALHSRDEHAKKENGGSLDVDAQERDNFFANTRPALADQAPRRAWGASHDPAYEAMLEQRDQLNANRRSERARRMGTVITGIGFLLQRGVRFYRQAHHLYFAKALLHLRIHNPETDVGIQTLPVLHAVQVAREQMKEAIAPENRRPSLGPSWITCKADNVKNFTSAAVSQILHAIRDLFVLDPLTSSASLLSWSAPIELGHLFDALNQATGIAHQPAHLFWRRKKNKKSATSPQGSKQDSTTLGKGTIQKRIILPHTLYFCILFISLASVAGLKCRLVIAKDDQKNLSEVLNVDASKDGTTPTDANTSASNSAVTEEMSKTLARISIFGPKVPGKGRGRKRNREELEEAAEGSTTANSNNSSSSSSGTAAAGASKRPSSCFWVEVWCPQRECYLSVNACESCTTVWGAPYTFAFGGDEIVDVTPRYISKYSTAFSGRLPRCSQLRFLYKTVMWTDTREGIELLLAPFNKDPTRATQARQLREQKQLLFLMYSETVPTTLAALKRHPLFVVESDLPRAEAIYPRDSTTIVGTVKGHTVYKRSAVVSLRSRDGWLRESRSLMSDDEVPYKTMPPPSSRPFAQNSCFFGLWQTKPFEPTPLLSDGNLPQHGRTSWYVVLRGAPAAGMTHISRPSISRVARRMQLDYRNAVVNFVKRQLHENRRGHWEAVIDGIVVKESEAAKLLHAYDEWVQLTAEQEARKRQQRAFNWWVLFSQRLMAMERVKLQYLRGAEHGMLPMY